MPAKAAPKKSKSAIKRARQTEARSLIRKSGRSMLKTLTKNVEREVASKSGEAAATLKKASSAFDKAARKGVVHKKTASRKVSRLTKLVNSMLPSEAV